MRGIMTKLLVSETNPKGYTTEKVLGLIRADIVTRLQKHAGDPRDVSPALHPWIGRVSP